MTYAEAVAMYPHDAVFGQIDDVVRPMTPAEYETFIQQQAEAVAQAEAQTAKDVVRQAVLDKLGLTADEAQALLG